MNSVRSGFQGYENHGLGEDGEHSLTGLQHPGNMVHGTHQEKSTTQGQEGKSFSRLSHGKSEHYQPVWSSRQ